MLLLVELNPCILGELLYIPGGAPHAAETLDDALMVASNDGSFKGMEELQAVCHKAQMHGSTSWRTHPKGGACTGDMQDMHAMLM